MLKINNNQMKVFERISLNNFEEEMVLHSKVFSPSLCECVCEEQLRITIHNIVKHSGNYGFTNRGSIRLYIELTFLYGKGFDTDPQYSKIRKVLTSSNSQMLRAKHLYEWVAEYQKKVAGFENINTRTALSSYLVAPIKINPNDFNEEITQVLRSLSPQKVEHVGRNNIESLLGSASNEGKEYGLFLSSGIDLLVVLKFLFGHACINDPFYPWILSTLKNKNITSPEARTKALGLEALNWLNKANQFDK